MIGSMLINGFSGLFSIDRLKWISVLFSRSLVSHWLLCGMVDAILDTLSLLTYAVVLTLPLLLLSAVSSSFASFVALRVSSCVSSCVLLRVASFVVPIAISSFSLYFAYTKNECPFSCRNVALFIGSLCNILSKKSCWVSLILSGYNGG